MSNKWDRDERWCDGVRVSRELDDDRRLRLGFSANNAARLSALHTRNFM